MSETWQIDIATSESDRQAGRVQIDAWSPLFDRRRIALVDRKEDAAQIVRDHNEATALRERVRALEEVLSEARDTLTWIADKAFGVQPTVAHINAALAAAEAAPGEG